jgi:general L-amino acid transport system permease protein
LILGTVIGVARLSSNWLVSKLAAIYIEVFQDIPVLLQLFFWYAFFYEMLPSPRQALNPIYGVFMCNRGLIFGVPAASPGASVHGDVAWPSAVFSHRGGCVRKWADGARTKRARSFLSSRRLFWDAVGFCPWLPGLPAVLPRP